jgi:hypothetical protein
MPVLFEGEEIAIVTEMLRLLEPLESEKRIKILQQLAAKYASSVVRVGSAVYRCPSCGLSREFFNKTLDFFGIRRKRVPGWRDAAARARKTEPDNKECPPNHVCNKCVIPTYRTMAEVVASELAAREKAGQLQQLLLDCKKERRAYRKLLEKIVEEESAHRLLDRIEAALWESGTP